MNVINSIGKALKSGNDSGSAGRKTLIAAGAVVVSFGVSMLIIAALNINPFEAMKSMISGALGSKSALAETTVKMTPLLFTAMSYALASRCGLINLGMEGQLYMGALASTAIGVYLTGLPAAVHIPMALLAGFIGGGLWGLLAGWLKVRFKADEVITTVLLNTIAINFIDYMVCNPMNEPTHTKSQTAAIQESAVLPKLISGTRMHLGFLIALLFVLLFWLFLWKSKKGYEMRVTGLNMGAARYSGINIGRNMLLVMLLSGGLSGLAGCCEILGVQKMMLSNISPGYGFDGMAVALIGMTTPGGILAGAVLFGILRAGGNRMQMVCKVPNAIVSVISGLIIIAVVASSILLDKWDERRLKNQKQESDIGGEEKV